MALPSTQQIPFGSSSPANKPETATVGPWRGPDRLDLHPPTRAETVPIDIPTDAPEPTTPESAQLQRGSMGHSGEFEAPNTPSSPAEERNRRAWRAIADLDRARCAARIRNTEFDLERGEAPSSPVTEGTP